MRVLLASRHRGAPASASPRILRSRRARCTVAAACAVLALAVAGVRAEPPAAAEAQAAPPVVAFEEVLRANPIDPVKGVAVTEILRGADASVNVWQVTDTMPAHLHRKHEEIIIVRSGRARARIGDRDVDLGPGDVFLVPRDTVHAARAIGEEPFVGVSVFAPAFDGTDRIPVPTPAAPTP